MDNRTSLDGLQLIRSASSSGSSRQQTKSSRAGAQSMPASVQASCARGRIRMTITDADVRMEKVSAIRAALLEGTYNVSASEVASSIADFMFGKRR
jgi:flagellar biosynthesis anti-sigma factor FlgM